MGLFHLTVCLLVAPALSAGSSLLQRSSSRQRTFAGFRYSPQDPAARTLLTLDTNHDGRIDPSEVAAFARSQDLDAAAATKEFSSIDANGDGVLDSVELQQVLGAATQQAAIEAAPAKVAVATQVEAAKEAARPSTPAAAPVQETPVEQPAKLVPTAVATSMAPEAASTQVAASQAAGPAELISEESRTSLQKAAENVAEELDLEEKEEQQARQLDRKAAEARASSTALMKQTTQDALDAGIKVAHTKTDELMAKISKIEDQAERAEVRASALRAKSKMEMEEGKQLMDAAKQALAQDSI